MEQPTNNVFQFQQQLQLHHDGRSMTSQGQGRNQQRMLQSKGNRQQHIIGGTHRGGPSFGMKHFASKSTLSSNGQTVSTEGTPNAFGKQQSFRNSQPSMYQDNHEMQSRGNQPLPAIFSSGYGSQNLQLERQTIQSDTMPQYPMLTSTSLGGMHNSDPVPVSQMKPSSSVNQPMSSQPQTYGMVNYDYMGNTSQFANFIESNLDARLNNLSLSNSYQYVGKNSPTGNGNIGRNTQERRISSPPLGSFSMTPSNSSTQQSQNGMISDSRQDSRMSYSRLMNQFERTPTIPSNGSSNLDNGYGLMAHPFGGSTFKPSPSEDTFGYFKNEFSGYTPAFSPMAQPPVQVTQAAQGALEDKQSIRDINTQNASSQMLPQLNRSDSSRISDDF